MINFINHASFIFRNDNVVILMDPWTQGSAFNDGWDLLSKSADIDYSELTHVWISHEHPDHFSIPDVKAIIQANSSVTFVFQATLDGRVASFIRKLGGKVLELQDNDVHWFNREDFIRIIRCGTIDSLAIVSLSGKTIINMNDCIVGDEIEKLHYATKDLNIDALFTQFGYASFISNSNQPELRERAVEKKFKQIEEQVDFFKPKFVIPFASFIVFSHAENFYMNDRQVQVANTFSSLQGTTATPVILYPGDTFNFENINSGTAIENYNKDWKKIEIKHVTKTVPFEILQQKAVAYNERMRKYHGNLSTFFLNFISKIYVMLGRNPFSTVNLYIEDLDMSVRFCFNNGLEEVSRLGNAHVNLGSQSIAYVLDYDWGIGSLAVNARMNVRDEKSKNRLMRVFQLGTLKSRGISLKRNPLQAFRSEQRIADLEPMQMYSEEL